ncbi:uncharacterized protein LOC124170362 [Ischnura elegans]|uniref:uncharacterized protein LOC124170362 n=1 Tax=Ischnura elegans TaxID=197161 RepID=UPI001ED87024|nr:uncharacterized protein LOC124170362 [Ischnura elegans]
MIAMVGARIRTVPGNSRVLLLMLFPFLYLLDIGTDIYVAYKHCSEANYIYFGLTLVFIFGPMLADLIGNMYLKWRGAWKTWKAVFSNLESLKLLPRALRSVNFAKNSRKEFDSDLCEFYAELNSLRGTHSEELAEKLRQSHMSLINAHSFAAMVKNEEEQLHWKLNEALNESAPQLLLQLVIVLMQLGNGETVGLFTYIGILASLASFSWTLHLIHYMLHYDGLVNNLKWFHRATEFLAHFLIVGCRFIAISIVMALFPGWFSLAALFYFGFLFLYLYKYSSDRDDYR